MIWDSLDTRGLGEGNIYVVLDDVVDTYSCGRHVKIHLEVEGGSYLMAPDILSGVSEAVISDKIRVGRSHPHYLESSSR